MVEGSRGPGFVIGLTPIYMAITLLTVAAIFFVVNRGRGILPAFAASLLAAVIFGGGYIALLAILLRNM
ncbi:MAG: hypothetical protein HYY30_11555 [Chloroflexi bacterium]|nr:hypothetical protein [Chloroflexota bacterium]